MRKHYDTLIIGHLSLDYNIDYKDNLVVELGGAVMYSSAAAYAGGNKVGVVTKLAKSDIGRLQEFVIDKEDIYFVPSQKSTSIRNKYFTKDKERRLCVCLSQADAFTLDDIPDVNSSIYHLAGLIYGDFDNNLIPSLANKGAIAVDVQAFLRHANGDNSTMELQDWKEKKELLPYITYLKTDAVEAEILTGQTDRYQAAKILHSWGAKEIVITHNTEVIAYDGNTMASYPIKARNLSGRSGRGDTTFASYITERLQKNVNDALLWATATVSHKMENIGPYRGNRNTITEYIEKFY
ncbi:MAG: ribokinase [Clostridiales bacterium]|nr:ribokinase [Clostridiales bacterium]